MGFNSTKIAITEITSTTDAELKLPERKRNEDVIQNLCNDVFVDYVLYVYWTVPHSDS